MSKPTVFKMLDVWVFRCKHSSGWTGNTFGPRSFRDPWTAAVAAAVEHWARFHCEGTAVE